ncbi:MAG: hypothetical protein A3A86_05410 [Elusimicrobia bacterium RIFCSPLOWO2_01_FULL_60_11]|nr:MAG: hypothetical protein A3A86_05410 [Elusimicrobia bacterium RIFCSPLOWO2_01_FULL_60_11]
MIKKGFDPRKWARLSGGLILSMFFMPESLFAGGAALILSGDLSSYREAAQGFKSGFDRPFKEYILPGTEDEKVLLMGSVRAQSPDIIIAVGSKAAAEALEHCPQTPLVYCMVINPESQGLVANRNAYGISFTVQESVLFSKYKAALPNLRRLGLIVERGKNEDWLEKAADAAKKEGIAIVAEKVGSNSDIPGVMRSLSGRIDAFWMTTNPILTNKFAFSTILDFCLNSKISLLVPVDSLVGAGGLMAVNSSAESMGAESAALSKLILDGRPPECHLAQPSKVEIVINMDTARKLGIGIPGSALRSAKLYPLGTSP